MKIEKKNNNYTVVARHLTGFTLMDCTTFYSLITRYLSIDLHRQHVKNMSNSSTIPMPIVTIMMRFRFDSIQLMRASQHPWKHKFSLANHILEEGDECFVMMTWMNFFFKIQKYFTIDITILRKKKQKFSKFHEIFSHRLDQTHSFP